jgi:hypothetical protein
MTTRGLPGATTSIAAVTMLAGLVAVGAQAPRFERVQPELFASGGAFVNAWADYDSDGDVDQFVGFDGIPNRLYRNTGGRFDDAAAAARVADARPTRAAAWGDADADGDPDLLVGFADAPMLKLYRNTKGVFEDDTASAGLSIHGGAVRQVVWVDYDGDLDLDLFVAFRDRANAMFRNDAGRFVDVAAQIGLADTRRTVGAVWFDHDEDGDLDVITGNMDGDANGLFSQVDGKFTDVAAAAGVEWGGRMPQEKTNGTVRPCVADVDNDGLLDLFFANYGKNGLFLGRGKGRYDNVSLVWGVDIDARYDSCAFADMDNDGDLDLYVNGTVTGGKQYDDFLFRNTGTKYELVSGVDIGSPNSDHGVQWIDFDLDGDADLSLTGVQKDGIHWLLRNTLTPPADTNVLNLRLLDENGRSTLAGASVHVLLGTGRDARRQRARVVDAGSGYNTQSDVPLHIAVPRSPEIRLMVTARRGRTLTNQIVQIRDLDRWRNRVYEVRLVRGAEQDERAVPVHEEPRHRPVFETAGTRVLDVQIPPGDTTLFHTHSDPILYVTMSSSQTRSQNAGAEWSAAAASTPAAANDAPAIAPTTPPGRMFSVTTYAERPQTHRVNNLGPSLFRLIGITNASKGDTHEGASAGFEAAAEISNPWFRGYRYVLRNGESAEHRHANPVAVVIAAGAGTVDVDSPAKSWKADRPGFLAFVEANTRHVLNSGALHTEILEVEVRRPR